MPITPKIFFCLDEWLCHAEQNDEKIFEFSMNFQNSVCLPHDRVKGRLGLVTLNPDISIRYDNKSEKAEYLKKKKKLLFSRHWLRVLTFLK